MEDGEEEEEEEEEEEKGKGNQPLGGLRWERTERSRREISQENSTGEKFGPKHANKPPTISKKQPKQDDMRRIIDEFLVKIPPIEAKVDGWASVLEIEEDQMEEDFFEERMVSTNMKNEKAIYMIAYYCSILNTDPSYIDPFFCFEDGFVDRQRTARPDSDRHERQYEDFRTVFGVVIAYIAGWLMHYHIEITCAMHEVEGGFRYVDSGNFIFWDKDKREWGLTGSAHEANYVPAVMKYITPYNFFRVRWPEFEGIVEEILDEFKGDNFAEFAGDVYRRTKSRYEFLQQPWVKTRRFSWRGFKSELCLGMARSAAQRHTIEKGDMPYDFLQTTVGGLRRDHSMTPGIPWEFAEPECDEWDVRDVFPGAPENYVFDFPASEDELDRKHDLIQPLPKGQKRKATPAAVTAPASKKSKSKKDSTFGSSSSSSSSSSKRQAPGKPSMFNFPPPGPQTANSGQKQIGAHEAADRRARKYLPSDDGDFDDESYEDLPQGPVRQEKKEWDEIKQGLLGLTAALPRLITWIDKSLDQRIRHSVQAKKLRLSKGGSAQKPKGQAADSTRTIRRVQPAAAPKVRQQASVATQKRAAERDRLAAQSQQPPAPAPPAPPAQQQPTMNPTEAAMFKVFLERWEAEKAAAAGTQSSSSSSSSSQPATNPAGSGSSNSAGTPAPAVGNDEGKTEGDNEVVVVDN
jgi:hypothetical protein